MPARHEADIQILKSDAPAFFPHVFIPPAFSLCSLQQQELCGVSYIELVNQFPEGVFGVLKQSSKLRYGKDGLKSIVV